MAGDRTWLDRAVGRSIGGFLVGQASACPLAFKKCDAVRRTRSEGLRHQKREQAGGSACATEFVPPAFLSLVGFTTADGDGGTIARGCQANCARRIVTLAQALRFSG